MDDYYDTLDDISDRISDALSALNNESYISCAYTLGRLKEKIFNIMQQLEKEAESGQKN